MISDIVLGFLLINPGISIGYSGIKFLKPEELDKGQIGYSGDDEGNSFIDGEEGCWREEWLVIGEDELVGDPIFVDTKTEDIPVFSAMHGEEKWEPIVIAHSFINFITIIEQLKIIAKNRENPVALQNNPIGEIELQKFLTDIQKANPFADINYWESFLEK